MEGSPGAELLTDGSAGQTTLRTPERVRVMYDWVGRCQSNKNGQGNRTGLLPVETLVMTSKIPPALPALRACTWPHPCHCVICLVTRQASKTLTTHPADDYFFASSERDRERQAMFATAFQQRCEC